MLLELPKKDEFKGYPEWFQGSAHARTYYNKEINLYFRVERDKHRFADGAQFFCRRCGRPCASRADYAEDHKAFIVTKVYCHLGCGQSWRLGVEPIWLRVLEDWEGDNQDVRSSDAVQGMRGNLG